MGKAAATAIADLNTHLGLQGEELQTCRRSGGAQDAKVNTNLFGDVAAQMGLDVEGTTGLLDDLVTVSQNTGVERGPAHANHREKLGAVPGCGR